eukprot:5459490-Pleurochrysis_carterae.AAC.1
MQEQAGKQESTPTIPSQQSAKYCPDSTTQQHERALQTDVVQSTADDLGRTIDLSSTQQLGASAQHAALRKDRSHLSSSSPAALSTQPRAIAIECILPLDHIPGQKLFWVSPTGVTVGLKIPEDAKPGQSLEFKVPRSLIGLDESCTNDHDKECIPREAMNSNLPSSELPDISEPIKLPVAETGSLADLPSMLSKGPGPGVTLKMKVPAGWAPGTKLVTTLMSGERVMISAPATARPGDELEFELPTWAVHREILLSWDGIRAQAEAAASLRRSSGQHPDRSCEARFVPAIRCPTQAPQSSGAGVTGDVASDANQAGQVLQGSRGAHGVPNSEKAAHASEQDATATWSISSLAARLFGDWTSTTAN